jgi:sugar phosphate isomerase/epimerase
MALGDDYSNLGAHAIYPGADYGFDSGHGSTETYIGLEPGAEILAGQFGVTTDPRTAAQLREVSGKLSTGTKTIEITGITPAELESIPNHHFEEINRLRKLTGVDLTFHGPLVEPTGVTRQGWNESHRIQAERQMWSAVERAQKIHPDGNVVITFHSSNGLPDPETWNVDEKTGKRVLTDIWVVDENQGRFESLTPKQDYFKSKEDKGTPEDQIISLREALEKKNKDAWFRQLQHASFNAGAGGSSIKRALLEGAAIEGGPKKETTVKIYKDYLEGKDINKIMQTLGDGPHKEQLQEQMNEIIHGDNYLRDAYQELQSLFNEAYGVSKQNGATDDLRKLDKYREELKKKLKYIEEPDRVHEFADVITQGVNVLRSIAPPKTFKPLRDFAVDKSAETFANLAKNAYDKFKNNAPIISVENPPIGMGLARGSDLKDIIETSRDKLQRKLVEESGLSKDEAKKQAEKLIGVTWDVGHINMLRKYGYGDKDIIEETKKVAPLVKHVHLSDNFGLEHTELPMGMGNVPTKPMLEAISKYNKAAKKIIETGGAWFRDFKISPLGETLRAFGSPLYSMQMGPTWGNVSNTSAGYFTGYGQMLPDAHFSIYGSGFANLPPELGGQMGGVSRASGAPME